MLAAELDAETLEVHERGAPEVVHLAPHVVDILGDGVDFDEVGFPLLAAEGVVDLGLVVVREVFAFGDRTVDELEEAGPVLGNVFEKVVGRVGGVGVGLGNEVCRSDLGPVED